MGESKPSEMSARKSIGLGLLSLGLSAYFYWDLTRFEQSGGSRRLSSMVALIYGLLGKWGVVATFSILGLLLLRLGIQKMGRKPAP